MTEYAPVGFTRYTDPDGATEMVCHACQCVVRFSEAHREVCPNIAREVTVADDTDHPWLTRPLTVVINTRNGQTFVIDGVQDDTRVSLTGLDAVDKAALRELLTQALREVTTSRVHTFPGQVRPWADTGGVISSSGQVIVSAADLPPTELGTGKP